MTKLNVLIAGSTGYIGIQLIKLLIKHKNINIKYLCGSSSVGKSIGYFEKSLKNKKLPNITKFHYKLLKNIDVVFTALPNGEAQRISNSLLPNNILIDLSADFRLSNPKEYFKWYKIKHKSIKNINKSIYALPEISNQNIKKYKDIETSLKKEEADLLSKKTVLSKEDYTKKSDTLRKKVIDYQSQRRAAMDKITSQRTESRATLIKSITPILEAYIKENNISVVIRKTHTLGGNPENDITKIIVDKLDKVLPSLDLK